MSKGEGGYSLVEVLIAAAIAGASLVMAASSTSTVAQLIKRTSVTNELVLEGENLLARLEAGMSITEAKRDFPGWQIDTEVYAEDPGATRYRVDEVRIVHKDAPILSFNLLRLARADAAVQ